MQMVRTSDTSASMAAMTDPGNGLTVTDLTIAIDGASVVDGVSFNVAPGEVLALVGESGCGKSLTAFALLGLLPEVASIERGRIELNGKDLTGLTDKALRGIRGRDLSIIFQEPTASLDPLTTVGAQIAQAYRLHHKVGRREAYAKARDMLTAVGIPDPDRRLDQYPFQLSGGMCQRIMIAIALINDPKILVADEPTTALDVTIQAQILDLIKGLRTEHGTGIVLITHDMGVVADIADRVAVMYAGRIVEIAPVRDLFAAPFHPYSALLLASVPRLDILPKEALATIDGAVPSPSQFGVGCRFADRCPLSSDRCHSTPPPLAEWRPGHRAACWHGDQAHRLLKPAA
jgi:peptide/nickel transport system ATP-binding protein